MQYLVDTNAILEKPEIVNDYNCVILSHVLREFESLERKGNKELLFKIRNAKRAITSSNNVTYDTKDYVVSFSEKLDEDYTDNKIIQCCMENDYGIITGDLLLQAKSEMYNIPLVKISEINSSGISDYTGVKELFLNPHDEIDATIIASIYENKGVEAFNLVENQYLVLWDSSSPTFDEHGVQNGFEPIDTFRFDGSSVIPLKYSNIDNDFTGEIKPVNVKQKLAFDMLQNKNITIKTLFGGFGVGKDFIMISHAVNLLLNNKIDKIIWVRNNIEVKDTNPIGFLPDGMESKLLPFVMPLADHLGGLDGLKSFLNEGKIEIQHLGFMRGRDIKNSIIYVTECENNTKEHIQLLIGRVGEGSQLWLNGDFKQVDNKKFEVNSGLNSLKKLGGKPLYGQVTLDKVERSNTARLADLLD